MLLVLLFFVASDLLANKVSLPFFEAIALKKIRLKTTTVDGLGDNNIQLDLLSLSNDSLQIYFEPGLMFEPENEKFQTLLLADSAGFMVYPREHLTVSLHGYCTESSDMGPRNVAGYRGIRYAPDDLQMLAKLISVAVAYDQQGLIWGYQNRAAQLNISLKTGKEKYEEGFNAFFASHRPGTSLTFDVQPEEVKPEPRHVVSIAANFPFMTDENRVLSLLISTEDGQVVRRYFQNKSYFAGAHILQFGFSDYYPEGTKFKAQLVNDLGEVFKEIWVDETTPFEEMDVHQIRYSYAYVIKKNLKNLTLTAYHENGEKVSVLKRFPEVRIAYHQLQLVFTHYFDPKTKFILELTDEEGKVYDKTEFDAYGKTKKLYQEWGATK